MSNLGRVKSLAFMRRCTVHGFERQRMTAERILAQQRTNSGYVIVHLHLNNKRTAKTVHRLVAGAFIPGTGATVNHKDSDRTNNAATNLAWATYAENNQYTVAVGRNIQAIRVIHPTTGEVFGSITQAARAAKCNHRTVRSSWGRA